MSALQFASRGASVQIGTQRRDGDAAAAAVEQLRGTVEALEREIGRIIVGQEIVVRGDLMLEVTGIGIRGVQDMAQIRDTLGTMKTGSPLAISVLRAGKVIELTGTLP